MIVLWHTRVFREWPNYMCPATLLTENRRGEYGQDLFTLRSMYLQGRPPPSVNMYWRRFAIADMPLHDQDAFDLWLRERWSEKDSYIEYFLNNGQFPANKAALKDNRSALKDITNGSTLVNPGTTKEGHIETQVKLAHWWEIGNIFVILASAGLIANLGAKAWNLAIYGKEQ